MVGSFPRALLALGDDDPPEAVVRLVHEIRNHLGSGDINLLVRVVSQRPASLEQLWCSVHPLVAQGRFESIATNLCHRHTELLPSMARLATQPDVPSRLVASARSVSARLLVLARAWRGLLLDVDMDGASVFEGGPAHASATVGRPPVERLAQNLGLPVVPTFLSAVASYPTTVGTLEALIDAERSRGHLAAVVSGVCWDVDDALRSAGWPGLGETPELDPDIRDAVLGFAEQLIPLVHVLTSLLDAPPSGERLTPER